MTITDASRYHLHQRLEQVLGSEEASVLMEHLPPVGWADVTTRRDLDALEERMDLRFDKVDLRFAAIDQRFEAIDRRFEAIDRRFGGIDRRFDEADGKLDERFEAFGLRIEVSLQQQIRQLQARMLAALFSVAGLLVALSVLGPR